MVRERELLSLIERTFPALSTAEMQLVRRFLALQPEPLPEVEPQIRASVIRQLCILCMHGRCSVICPDGLIVLGDQKRRPKIIGDLQLQNLEIPFPLRFQYCDFTGYINLNDASTKTIELIRCRCNTIEAQHANVTGNLVLRDLDLSISADLRGIKVSGDAVFTGAAIGARRLQQATDADTAVIGGTPPENAMGDNRESRSKMPATLPPGETNAGDAKVLNLDRADIGGTVFFNTTDLKRPFSCTGEVSVKGILIRGNLNCEGGDLRAMRPVKYQGFVPSALVANQAVIKGSVYLRKGRSPQEFRAEGQIMMLETEIFGDLDCDDAIIHPSLCETGLSVDRSHIRGSAFLRRTKSFGKVRFIGTRIDGDLDCSSGAFFVPENCLDAPLNLQRVRVDGTLLLIGVITEEVYLPGARIGVDLNCEWAYFELGAKDPERVKSAGKKQIGINAAGAVIGGEVNLSKVRLQCKADIPAIISLIGGSATRLTLPWSDGNNDGIQAENPFVPHRQNRRDRFSKFFHESLERWREDLADLAHESRENGVVGLNQHLDCIVCKKSTLKRTTNKILLRGILQAAKMLNIIEEKPVNDKPISPDRWDRSKYRLSGFSYKYIWGCDNKRQAFHWLKRIEFDTRTYEQLAAVLSKKGDKGLARTILVWKERHRGRTMPWLHRNLFRIFSWVGYGYKPEKALLIASVAIFIAYRLFNYAYHQDLIVPYDKSAYYMLSSMKEKNLEKHSPPNYSEFSPFWYTLDVFIPSLDLGQEKNWHPLHPTVKTTIKNPVSQNWVFRNLVYYFHPVAVVFGSLLIGLALLGPIGLVRRSLPEGE